MASGSGEMVEINDGKSGRERVALAIEATYDFEAGPAGNGLGTLYRADKCSTIWMMRTMGPVCTVIVWLLGGSVGIVAVAQAELSGRVVRVLDGDTLEMRHAGVRSVFAYRGLIVLRNGKRLANAPSWQGYGSPVTHMQMTVPPLHC